MPRTIQTISLEDAQQMIAAGQSEADSLGIPYNIAVADAGGRLIAFARQDGAWQGSIDIAIDKAFTARAFDMSTADIAEKAQPGEPLFGLHSTNHDRVVVFGGGEPVKLGDDVIGAVGASGGTPKQDEQVAKAALKALARELESA